MEKDFHYYLIYAVSKITGFDKADIIASSSQFVDDNNEGQFSIDERPSKFPEEIPAAHVSPLRVLTSNQLLPLQAVGSDITSWQCCGNPGDSGVW